ncbi:phosphoribosyltransferase family protein [Fulvivirgaceae bacterium BMA10]|uniref:Phosphoribosyltransferase family protein n=1 Tax=Splendidivirga corallicola TaxID=3051826 RepID=A0ABT8KMV5_9BACT|nr:phosphoribosyltransferase family protein [Fulvivirgaceae bacterium BMA10]
MHKFKYDHFPEIGNTLGKWYGADLKEHGYQNEIDLILPIPLHENKLKQRGFNQSDFFALGLSQSLDVPFSNKIIARSTKSETQTKKGRLARWKNVKEIFLVLDELSVIGKRVLLVDDVITTGSTLESCALTLQESGCGELSFATLAVAK